MKRSIVCVFACAAFLMAADNPPTDKITISEKLDIAATQRDLLMADSEMKESYERFNAAQKASESLRKSLNEKIAAANKSCGADPFDPIKLSCAPKQEHANPAGLPPTVPAPH